MLTINSELAKIISIHYENELIPVSFRSQTFYIAHDKFFEYVFGENDIFEIICSADIKVPSNLLLK